MFLKNLISLLLIILSILTCFATLGFSQEKYQIEFISPEDNSKIPSMGVDVTKIPCEGKVIGKIDEGFRIKIRIFTDQWYDQGIAKVKIDGTWKIDPIYLGGDKHSIEATLSNAKGMILATKSITVFRVHDKQSLQKESNDKEYQIEFISPLDGEEIPSKSMAVTTIPCKGKVAGKDLSGLFVVVRIFTDQWYDQGKAKVNPDNGNWSVDPIHLGSSKHIIEAQLKDNSNKELARQSITIWRIQ
jgi:DNA-dependent RNA polymerase auxiliary subunit epsilon